MSENDLTEQKMMEDDDELFIIILYLLFLLFPSLLIAQCSCNNFVQQ